MRSAKILSIMKLMVKQLFDFVNKNQKPNQVVVIDHELRFLPTMKKMKELIADGRIGNIFHVEGNLSNGFRAHSKVYSSRIFSLFISPRVGLGGLKNQKVEAYCLLWDHTFWIAFNI
jgi:hypothetical protein